MTNLEDCKKRWDLVRNARGYDRWTHPALNETVDRLIAIAESQENSIAEFIIVDSGPDDEPAVPDYDSLLFLGRVREKIRKAIDAIRDDEKFEAVNRLSWLSGVIAHRLDGDDVFDEDEEEVDDDE